MPADIERQSSGLFRESGKPEWEDGNGARGRSRTADTVIFSHVLYQLSYPGIAVASGRWRALARWKRAYGEGGGACPAPRLLNRAVRITFRIMHGAGQRIALLQPVHEIAVAAAR